MEQITVVIEGEIKKLNVSIEKELLDDLDPPPGNKADWVTAIGQYLDGKDPGILPTEDRDSHIGLMILEYVSTLSSYKVMSAMGYKTLVLTFFRTKGVYKARVAGILPYDYLKTSCTLDGHLIPTNDGLLFIALSTCPHYTQDKYEKSSIFHKRMEEAKIMGPMIKIAEAK